MSDHNFEKQIQQKLEELKIPPADAVWSGVQAQIRKDKSRRRGVVFLPVFLLLIGACSYFIFQDKFASSNGVTSRIPSSNSNVDRENSTTTTKPLNDQPVQGEQTADRATNKLGDGGNDLEKQTNNTSEDQIEKIGKSVGSDRNLQLKPEIGFKKTISKSNTPVNTKTRDVNTKDKTNVEQLSVDKSMDIAKPETPGFESKEKAESADPDKSIVSDAASANPTIQPIVSPSPDSASNNKMISDRPEDSLIENINEEKSQPVRIKYPNWKWGITVSAGISNLSDGGLFNGVLGGEKALVADVAVNPNSNGPQSGGSGIHRPSAIEKGFSYSIGGLLQKRLNKKFSLSTGIRYSYHSTHIRVGSRIDSVRQVQNAFGALNVSGFYRATPIPSPLSSGTPTTTQKYTNDFHFLELPLSVHMRLNKGKRLPIFWNGGVSLSYLLSTSALHFDSNTGVYYKDNSLFNKLQANVSTGLSISLFSSSKHSLDIGPHFQYGLTTLMKGQVSSDKHLYYYGITARIFLKE